MFAFFERLSIGQRILAGFGVSVVMSAAIVAATIVNSGQMGDAFDAYQEKTRQSLEIGRFTQEVYDARLAVFEYTTSPSEEAAANVRKRLEGLSKHLKDSGSLFDGESDVVTEVRREVSNYLDAFSAVAELEAESQVLLSETMAMEPKFEQALNGFLFTARITSDQNSIDAGAASILAFERGVGEFHGFLANGDAKKFDAAGPLLAEARSELESASSKLKIKGRDAKTLDGVIAVLDGFRAKLPEIKDMYELRDISREELSAVGPRLLQQFVALQDRIVERQTDIGAKGQARIGQAQLMSLAIGGVGIAVAIGLALLIGRLISSAVNRQAEAMSRLAAGDLSAPVQGAEHQHELGRMAQALKVFKDNALSMKAMQEDKERQEAEAAAARAKMMQQLRSAFGDVVDAAVAGDFSKRVDAQFADEELNGLARGVNRLVETVNSGLSETGRVLSQIASGDLSDRMHGQFEGAFAELKVNVNNTVARLSELVDEITDNVDIVGRGAGEISSGAADLSNRAEQQASSLEETAATMEEMSGSIKSNAESSNEAQNLASAASERAKSGGAIVTNAVSAMGEIEDSATKIADIISVIDGIAFQTNLLALNAAVEAARAGDAGKGFAVVASEVRALAQRSSDAAQDIRGLIETSAGQVSHGVRLVTETGEALEGIVASIAQVEETVGKIAEVSREQATGVQEISSAIGHMDGMTQQNSSLADQSAANARSLAEGAEKLQQLVAFFQVSQQGGQQAPEAEQNAA